MFPRARPLPVNPAPPTVQSPAPMTLPSAPANNAGAAKIADSTQCVEFQSFVIVIPGNLE